MVLNINTTSNGHTAPADLGVDTPTQAQTFFESLETVNLDEVTIDVVRVGLRDCKDDPITGKRTFFTRVAEVQNFVPMRVFNQMMASRTRVMAKRQAFLDNPTAEAGAETDPMMGWMMEQVLSVWQISEPDMTMERLENGLPFEKVSRLFTVFFGHLLQPTTR